MANHNIRYLSHPVADVFKQAVKPILEEMYAIIPGDYEYGGADECLADIYSFAHYYFVGSDGRESRHTNVYIYALMDTLYVETLNEYIFNQKRFKEIAHIV